MKYVSFILILSVYLRHHRIETFNYHIINVHIFYNIYYQLYSSHFLKQKTKMGSNENLNTGIQLLH